MTLFRDENAMHYYANSCDTNTKGDPMIEFIITLYITVKGFLDDMKGPKKSIKKIEKGLGIDPDPKA